MVSLLQFLNKRRALILLCLFLISLTLRLFVTYRDYSRNHEKGWSDALLYLSYGESFAQGDFYPKVGNSEYMIVGPVIPFFVAASKWLTGNPIWFALFLNCLLSALLVYVLFEIGSKVIGLTAGYFLSIWSVFNISFIRQNYQILKEPLVILLLPLIVLSLVNIYNNKKTLFNTILSSLIFSVLIHADERYIVYCPIFLLFIFFTSLHRIKYKLAGIWIVILLITMIPWTVRNYKQFGEIVILSPRTTSFTSKLWGTDFAKMHFSSEDSMQRKIISNQDDAIQAKNKYGVQPRIYGKYEKYYKAFIHYWKPTYFKLTYIMYGNRPVKWSLSHNISSLIFYGIFLPFYLFGLFLSIFRKKWLIVYLGSIPVFHSLLHTLMLWPLERYRLPMSFLIVLIAIWAINDFISNRLNSKNTIENTISKAEV